MTMTDNDLKMLAFDAQVHGDDALCILALIALGDLEPVTSAEEWEDRYGGGGYSDAVRDVLLEHGASIESALAMCKSARHFTP